MDALAGAICADPHAPPGLTLEQARFDALVWLITGQPAWPPPETDTDTDEHTDHDDDVGAVIPGLGGRWAGRVGTSGPAWAAAPGTGTPGRSRPPAGIRASSPPAPPRPVPGAGAAGRG